MIPFVVVAWVFSTPPQYEAQAGVWVERPAYLNYSGDELTRYLPPAKVQLDRLSELMRDITTFSRPSSSAASKSAAVAVLTFPRAPQRRPEERRRR